jgi:CBS domain-containing protein
VTRQEIAMGCTTRLTAGDIMMPEPVCVERSTRVRELARVFEEHAISGAPVLDSEGRVVGVVSKTDLIRRCAQPAEAGEAPAYLFEVLREGARGERSSDVMPEPLVCVEDFMTTEPLVVSPDEPALNVGRLMVETRVHRVIVVDTEHFPVGIITTLDMIAAMSRTDAAAPGRSCRGRERPC